MSGRVPIELVTFEAQRFSPLALGYLHARLEGDPKLRDAVDVRINVASANDDPRGVAEAIIARGPAVVGLSVYVWNARQSYELARLIRTALPQAVIIAGGPEVGPQPTEVLEAQAALDVVVLGEGEGPFGDMVGALLRGEGFAGIPGLAIRDDAGGIVLTADRPPAPSLADLPSPFQLGTLPPRDGETACIETHRGCTFACRFCYYHKAFGATRLLEEDRVRADLRILLDSGVERIYLMDPTFNEDLERAKAICRLIIDLAPPEGLSFHTEVRAERLDEELVGLMRQAGIDQLEVGLQSSSAELLKDMKRGHHKERFERGVGLLSEAGLSYELQLIFALPGDTWEAHIRSLRYVIDLSPTLLGIYLLRLLPGTEYRTLAKDYGLECTDGPPHFVTSHAQLSDKELLEGRVLGHLIAVMWNTAPRSLGLLCQEFGVDVVELAELAVAGLTIDDLPTDGELGANWLPAAEARRFFVDQLERVSGRDLSFFGTCIELEVTAPPSSSKNPRR